jgi:LPXTG-motif cell wall-anchored protein
MNFNWTTIVALLVIVVAIGFLFMKRRQRNS